jgi:outer membrane protein assembly factor BamB
MKKFTVVILLLLLAACSSSPSPVQPPAPLVPLENAFPIERTWHVDVGQGASDDYLRLTPLVHDGLGYEVSHRGLLDVFDIKTGSMKWQAHLDIPVSCALGYDGERLLLGTSDGEVLALDPADGKVIWRVQLSSEILSTPQGAKGIVVARSLDGHLYGLDAQTGKQLWSVVERVPSLTLRGTSDPVIVNDMVIVGNDNGRLIAVSLGSGKVLWENEVAVPSGRNELERMVDIDAPPVVVDNTIYVVAYQGRLAALRLGSGQIIWTRDIDSYVGFVVDAYRIYMADTEGQVWALDRNTGATLWKQDKLVRRKLSRPALHKDYLVVGDYNGYLHWLKRDTGKLVARRRITISPYDKDPDPYYEELFSDPHNILAHPLGVGDLLIGTDRRGVVQAFKPDYPQ